MASYAPRDVKEKPEVTSYKDELSKQAEHVILEVFPQKIVELHHAFEGDMFNRKDLTALHWDDKVPPPPPLSTCNGPPTLVEEDQPMTKKRKLDEAPLPEKGGIYSVTAGPKLPVPQFSGVIPSNPKIVAVVDFLKPEIIQMMDQCNLLKMWIQLMIPKIEDGNNFGVSIQEEILGEVSKAEADSGSYLEQMSRYFSSRAKLVSKVAKYPYLDDYRRSVNEYDEKVFLSFKLMLRELRNIYVVLYDLIVKNYAKIVHPRNSNTSTLY